MIENAHWYENVVLKIINLNSKMKWGKLKLNNDLYAVVQ